MGIGKSQQCGCQATKRTKPIRERTSRLLRGGMVPALVDQVLKVSCLLRREQRS